MPIPVGRPKADTASLTLRLPRELIAQLDELRRAEADLPGRQEMIRRILTEYAEARRANLIE